MRKMFTALAAAGALACSGAMAASGATPARHPSPIRHIVVIYMENHSFDSILGFWCNDHPRRCPDGGMPQLVMLSDGALVVPSVSPDTVPNVVHSVFAQRAAINHGQMNGWQNIPAGTCAPASGYRCISGYMPAQVPNLAALAQRFAISDDTFSLADSPSFEGHIDMVAASSDGFFGAKIRSERGVRSAPGWGCDSNKVTPWVSPDGTLETVPTCVPDHALRRPFGGAFRQTPVSYIPTIMDRLDAARLNWKIYGATKGTQGYGMWDICPTFAECLDTRQDANLVPDAQFMTDAAAGALPGFSVVTPGGPDFLNSCHNGTSMTACDNWIGQLVNAVQTSPDWSSTAIFITFDDCGCFYDQVPPPTAPDGTQEGPRVPLIIVSPYAKPGYTDRTETTFAGILAYAEHTFGLAPLGVNDARAYDFRHAFNYAQAPLPRVKMVNRPLPASAKRIHLTRALEDDPT